MLLFALFTVVGLFAAEASPARSRGDCELGADGQCIGSRAAAMLQAVRTSEGSERQVMSEDSEEADEVGAMHAQSLVHLETLTKLKDANGALPDTVRTLLTTIKNHSVQVQRKLTSEHTTQKAALQARFDDIAACESHLNAVTIANSNNSSSLKSLAAQALHNLCSYRLTQAQKSADLQGCKDQLACYGANRDSKSTTMNGILRNADGTAKEVYHDPTDMCANSDQWANAAGSSDSDKAVAWLTSQKSTWTSALEAKIKTLEDLQTDYNAWNAKYHALKDGTGNFQGKGCDDLEGIKNTDDNTCSLRQAQATLRQCVYSEEVKNGCDQYTVCRTAAVTAWNTKKLEQNQSSQDREEAWMSAAQIMCIVDQLLDNSSTSTACSNTCGTTCQNNTDLSAILGRSYSHATTCTVPGKSCDSWTPTCNTQGWTSHTATYQVGSRNTSCEGAPAAAALTMPSGDACQACGNLAMCDSFTCQSGTNRGFNVICPGGVCNTTTCCDTTTQAPTNAPTNPPTAAPTNAPPTGPPAFGSNDNRNLVFIVPNGGTGDDQQTKGAASNYGRVLAMQSDKAISCFQRFSVAPDKGECEVLTLDGDGNVVPGPLYEFNEGGNHQISLGRFTSTEGVLCFDTGGQAGSTCRIFTINADNSISYGTPVTMENRFASGVVPSIGVHDETHAVVCCGGGKSSNVQYYGFCTMLKRSGTDIAKGNEVRVSDTQLHLNLQGGHGADVTILKNGGAIVCSAVKLEGECKYLTRMGDDGMQLKSDSRITFETKEINHVGVATMGANGDKALLCYGDRFNSYTKCTLITTAGTFVKADHPMVSMEAMDRWDMISVDSNSAMLCGRPQARGGNPNKRDYTIACHVINYDESADTVTISSQSEDITEDSRNKNDYRYVSMSMVDGTNTIFLCSNMDMYNDRCTTIGTPAV